MRSYFGCNFKTSFPMKRPPSFEQNIFFFRKAFADEAEKREREREKERESGDERASERERESERERGALLFLPFHLNDVVEKFHVFFFFFFLFVETFPANFSSERERASRKTGGVF